MKKCKMIGIFLLLIISLFAFAFFLVHSLISMINEFCGGIQVLSISLIVSGTITLFQSIAVLVAVLMPRVSKFGNWLSMNISTLILAYIFLLVLFNSIKNEIYWEYSEIVNVIEMQWTIFGLSIAIYLVWCFLVKSYLDEKKKPKDADKKTIYFVKKWLELRNKEDFHVDASIAYSTVSFLYINLFILCSVTLFAYLFKDVMLNVWSQNIVRFSFCFSIQTLIKTFVELIKPLREEKKKTLEEAKVKNKEIDELNHLRDNIKETVITIRRISESTCLDEEQKKKITQKLLKETFGEEIFSLDIDE